MKKNASDVLGIFLFLIWFTVVLASGLMVQRPVLQSVLQLMLQQ